MEINVIKLIIFFTIPLCLYSCSNLKYPTKPVAVQGLIDLTKWDLEKSGNINLDGEWEFYWKEFLEPKDFDNLSNSPIFLRVPTNWEKYKFEGRSLGRAINLSRDRL